MLDRSRDDAAADQLRGEHHTSDRVVVRDNDGVHATATPVDHAGSGSLIDDVTALYEDGKTYLSSELTFQKTRAKYAGKQGGETAVFGFAALTVLNLALIGLTVGLILTLATLVGPLAATLIVVVSLLIVAGVLAYMAKKKAAKMSRVLSGGRA